MFDHMAKPEQLHKDGEKCAISIDDIRKFRNDLRRQTVDVQLLQAGLFAFPAPSKARQFQNDLARIAAARGAGHLSIGFSNLFFGPNYPNG